MTPRPTPTPHPQTPIPQLPEGGENLKRSTSERKDISELFRSLNIREEDPVYASKKEPGETGVPTPINTNCFVINGIQDHSVVHQFDFSVFFEVPKKDGKLRRYEFNRPKEDGFKDDDFYTQTKQVIMAKLYPLVAFVLENEIGIPKDSCISDLNRLFYTVDKRLTLECEKSNDKTWTYDVTPHLLSYIRQMANGKLKDVAKVSFKFLYTATFDYTGSSAPNSEDNKRGMQFLNLLVDMKIRIKHEEWAAYENGRNYMIDPKQFGFTDNDSLPLPDGKYIAIGSRGSVKPYSNNGGGDRGYLYTIDPIKTAFHSIQPLSDKYIELMTRFVGQRREIMDFSGMGAKKVLENTKGLICLAIHLGLREIKIHTIDHKSAKERTITVDKRTITIEQYYKEKYNITLKHPDFPLAVHKVKKRDAEGVVRPDYNYYPLELLQVADYQRVKKNAQTPEQIKAMIKACSITPSKRIEQISKMYFALHIEDSEFLKFLQYDMGAKPVETFGRILDAPKIIYSRGSTVNVRNDNKSWELGRQEQFLSPGTIKNWGCYYFEPVGRNCVQIQDMKTFVQMFTTQARLRGVKIDTCYELVQIAIDESALKKLFIYLKNEKADFALFLTPDNVTGMHKYIKAFEREYEVTTQDLRHSTVNNVVNKKQIKTLDNIIMKSNVKVGGLNYSLMKPGNRQVIKEGTLVIGIGFNHTKIGDSDSLSTVGFAANTKKVPTDFVGDVTFTDYRSDRRVSFYDQIFDAVVSNYMETKNEAPTAIIIYRVSGSEGRYDEYLSFDLPYIKHIVKNKCPNAGITFIIVEKDHNLRFFKNNIDHNAKAPLQNVVPGTVVDNGVMNPRVCEFYLNTHSGLQGTCKTPRYSILYDSNNLTMDDIQNLTNDLSYGYQIVNLPTSLPAPVYIANQYAERGRLLLSTPIEDSSSERNLETLKKDLGYFNSVFNNVRLNA
uniref:Piwi domain-containing protein n=1 Tax=Parastrongyloides trichosuri TaxID=131310 RepID=A0A0N4ZIH1_PARTI